MYHCCDMLGSWHDFMTSRSSILSRKQCTTSTKRGHMNIAFTIALFISHLRSPSTHLQRSNKMDTQLSSPPSHTVVDKKYILFQYVLPFIRARFNRRLQEAITRDYQKMRQEQEEDPYGYPYPQVIKCLRWPSKDGLQCCHNCDKLVCKRCIARYKTNGDPICIPCFEKMFKLPW